MSKLTPTLKKNTAKELLGEYSDYRNPVTNMDILYSSNPVYQQVQSILDKCIINEAHSFRLEYIVAVDMPAAGSRDFKARLELKSDSDIRFLFYSTKRENQTAIYKNGFSLSNTDEGHIGRGVYLTSGPEYCASYIKDTAGITPHKYTEPVEAGIQFEVLGCIALVGKTKQIKQNEVGCEITEHFDSHWAYVTSEGQVTGDQSKRFAEEYAMREPEAVYPRFRISLKRITREVIWVDQIIDNAENSRYVQHLKQVSSIFLYATASADEALAALKRRKQGTEYRAITAGRGGESFVRKLRQEGIDCKVLVFTSSEARNKPWADRFKDVTVTVSTHTMMMFATWSS